MHLANIIAWRLNAEWPVSAPASRSGTGKALDISVASFTSSEFSSGAGSIPDTGNERVRAMGLILRLRYKISFRHNPLMSNLLWC